MTQHQHLKLIAHADHDAPAEGNTRIVHLGNDADPFALKDKLAEIDRIDLDFPAFTDGRAYSQAYLLRRRLGFQGDLRATGDVLIDQLLLMQRTGFSSAVLKEGVDPADAQRQFEQFSGFYQADAEQHEPVFKREQPAAASA
ncbi:MAG: hypothetical protein GAK30_00168 [Paracidovorax wautersii]|uniref:DUF934 domain-containing protein n=1 Tax=Paracidovorax wautersii TaxID=1177982 RepID=A0A7V8FS54_9BURK|nr:MAG: hypothetical protein GAK30_00168 [Paracidovorax wautersii]